MKAWELRQAALGKELDVYIARRRVQHTMRLSAHTRRKKMGIFGKLFGTREDDYDFAPEVDFQPPEGVEATSRHGHEAPLIAEPQKRGWFFSRRKEEVPVVIKEPIIPTMSRAEQDLAAMRDDMKEVTKIFLRSWERLPPEQVSSLKRSDEFERLKGLLKKHELIK